MSWLHSQAFQDWLYIAGKAWFVFPVLALIVVALVLIIRRGGKTPLT